jgi:hypothetical protein
MKSIRIVVLLGGVLLAGFGSGSVQAATNPFDEILDLLNQINRKVTGTVDLCHGGSIVGRFVPIGTTEVCDRTTGLTWQKTPAGTDAAKTWADAKTYCQTPSATVAAGSRLPEVKELINLVDYSQVNPSLPPNNPFIGVGGFYYWAATENAGLPTFAWAVVFGNGVVFNFDKLSTKLVWCVRGA